MKNTQKNNTNASIESIIDFVNNNPNDADLGERVRHYIKSNAPSTDPNQLTISFGGQYEDYDEEDTSIDVGDDISNNLSIG